MKVDTVFKHGTSGESFPQAHFTERKIIFDPGERIKFRFDFFPLNRWNFQIRFRWCEKQFHFGVLQVQTLLDFDWISDRKNASLRRDLRQLEDYIFQLFASKVVFAVGNPLDFGSVSSCSVEFRESSVSVTFNFGVAQSFRKETILNKRPVRKRVEGWF